MADPPRLPLVDGDDGTWGDILNEFLEVAHNNPDGTLKSSAVSDAGAEMATNKDTDGTLAANSDTKYPSQKAVKTYVDTTVSGKVSGPASSTDNAIARYDGTTGKLVQDSGVTIDDSSNITTAARVNTGTLSANKYITNAYASGSLNALTGRFSTSSSTTYSDTALALTAMTDTLASGYYGGMTGVYARSYVLNNASAEIIGAYGGTFVAERQAGSSTALVRAMTGGNFVVNNASTTAPITDAYAGMFSITGNSTNAYGVYVDSITGTHTSQYGVYQEGASDKNYFGGQVGIGVSPSSSAALDVSSTTRGVLLPRMTTIQKNAITSPAIGLTVYDTDLKQLCTYDGAAWQSTVSMFIDTDGTLAANSDTRIASQKAVKTYVDTAGGSYVTLTGNQTISGTKTFTAAPGLITDSGANGKTQATGFGGGLFQAFKNSTDSQAAIRISAPSSGNAAVQFGVGGSTATDSSITRTAANELTVDSNIVVSKSSTAANITLGGLGGGGVYLKNAAADTEPVIAIGSDGTTGGIIFGPGGSTATDTAVSRSAAGELTFSDVKLRSLVDPTDAQDAATKNYVDNNRLNGGVVNNLTALQPFWDALRDATATVITIGDSITYGLYVSQNQSYPEVFNQNMISRYGGLARSWTVAGGVHLTGDTDASDSTRGLADTGTPTVTVRGLGAASVSFTKSGDSQTYTTPFACTEVRVWYKKGPSQGNLQITVDGGAPVTIDTGNAAVSWNNIWTTGTLSSAVHTVKVEPVTGGSLNSGYNVEIGAYEINPSASGTRLYNASRSGAETKEFIQANNPHWEDALGTIDPQVVSIHLGTNDKYYGRTVASTKANFIEIIDTINTKCSTQPAIVLYKLKLSPGYFDTIADVQPYWDMVDQLQALYPSQIIVVDLYKLFGDSSDNVNGMFPTAGLMGVHPGVRGHYVLGNLLADTLLPPYSQSADAYLSGDIYANNITASNSISAVSLATSKAISIGKNLGDSQSITTTGKVTIGDTLNVTGAITAPSLAGDISGRTSTPIEVITSSISVSVAQLGKILVYNGTGDITVTWDSAALSLMAYVYPTTLVQLNTGKITIAAAGSFSMQGVVSTSGVGQRLVVFVPATTVTKVFCTLLGNQMINSVNAQTGTSYTFTSSDKDIMVTASNAAAQTYTIPANSSVAYPVGTELNLLAIGAGTVTATGASGVTVNGTVAGSVALHQYQTLVLYKIATDTWQGEVQSTVDTDGTFAANSDSKVASQKATKTYVDTRVVTPRVNTLTVSGSTYTIDTDTTDVAIISSPTANFTIDTSGTPADGQLIRLRVVNGSTAYTPTWDSIFMSSGGAFLPNSYTASKTNLHLFEYVASQSKWILTAFDSGF